MAGFEAKGILPVDPKSSVDFLFGRKFLMKGIPSSGALEVIVKTNAPMTGFKQHLVIAAERADGSVWDVINNKEALEATVKVAPGSIYDNAAASVDVVNTRIIAFLVTEPAGTDDPKKPWPWDRDPEEGCNAGASFLVALALVGFMFYRKF
jgi:hypothetical protein